MASDRDLGALKRADVFSRLSPAEFAQLLSLLPRRRLIKGDVLFRQGDPGDWMAIVIDGRLNVVVEHGGGEVETARQLGAGEVVGEMACVDPERRSATVMSPWEATVLLLDRDLLSRLRFEAPRLASGILGGIIAGVTGRIRETNQRITAEQVRRGPLLRGAGAGLSGVDEPAAVPELPASLGVPLPEPGTFDLSQVPVLGGLTNADLGLLHAMAPPRRYAGGALLCREGQVGTSCYLLLSGEIEVLRGAGDARQRLAVLTPGTLVGQLALVDKEPRSASLITRGETLILELERDVFERLLVSAGPLALRFQELIAVAGVRQLRLANQRLAELTHGEKAAVPASRRAFTPEEQARLRAIAQMVSKLDTTLAQWDLSIDDLRALEL